MTTTTIKGAPCALSQALDALPPDEVSFVLRSIDPVQWAEAYMIRTSRNSPTLSDHWHAIRAAFLGREACRIDGNGLPEKDGSDAVCPFCGAPEASILADDECLHSCEACERTWYIDEIDNVLPADRCPVCEVPEIEVDEQGARTCGGCGHRFFFDGLTYVDPATVEAESAGVA